MAKQSCSDCGSTMEEGFIPDRTYGSIMQLNWHRGRAEELSVLGLKLGVNFDLKQMISVTAMRCTNCGLLKLYAPEA